jgi:hypothetical protein
LGLHSSCPALLFPASGHTSGTSSLIYENLAVQRKIARKNAAKSVSCMTPPGNLLHLAGNCAPHALGVIVVLCVVSQDSKIGIDPGGRIAAFVPRLLRSQ